MFFEENQKIDPQKVVRQGFGGCFDSDPQTRKPGPSDSDFVPEEDPPEVEIL